jgi:hypothetical protein
MTYPAEIDFKRDRTISPSARRVYGYLTTELDFNEVRVLKSQYHSAQCGVDRADFIHALDALVACGYLIEHARGARNVRRFTLAYSVNPTRAGRQTAI